MFFYKDYKKRSFYMLIDHKIIIIILIIIYLSYGMKVFFLFFILQYYTCQDAV